MAKKKEGVRKYEKGNPYNKENRVEAKYIEADTRVKSIYRILDWYKEGINRNEIKSILLGEGLTETAIDLYIQEAHGIVFEQFSTQTEHIISLHTKRYDKQINSLLNKDYNQLALKIRFKVKSTAYFDALDTLYQKEKLLNLHSKQTIIRFNQRNNINVNTVPEKKEKYDLSKLSFEEKVDFMKLVEKASPRNNVNTGVILRERKIEEEEIIEIEHEDVTNIDLIEKENIIGKDVFVETPPRTMFDLQEKLRMTLQKVAQQELEKAGSKTVTNERKL